MLNNILTLIFLTLLPFLELRASIPYGILVLKINWFLVFFICIIFNIILGPVLYLFLNKIVHIFLRVNFIKRIYDSYVLRTQKSIHKYIEKYGELGVAIFIGIPLPGSGVYSGALAAYLLGLSYKKFIIATIIGVLIAGIIVTIVTLTGSSLLNIFVKKI
jgi:uncharacterized membrane protein